MAELAGAGRRRARWRPAGGAGPLPQLRRLWRGGATPRPL